MTEKDAKRSFCEVAPKGKDRPAFRLAWSGYVDNLVRDGRVSEKRAKNWRGPQRCGTPGKRPGAFGAAAVNLGSVTKQDFEVIAKAFCRHGAATALVNEIADYFGRQNPRFNADRFVAATRKC